MIGVSLRASIFDRWVREFIAGHPDAIVLHLGCGLDSRVFRLDPPASVQWFDVDYPEVIALRRRLFPERPGYTMIGSPVTDRAWLDAVPADRPTMIVAEGLFMYLDPGEVPGFVDRLTARPPGGELALDAFSRLGAKLIVKHQAVKATGAAMGWTTEDPRELAAQVPRLRLIDDFTAYDPRGYDPRQVARLSWAARMTVRMFAVIPRLGKISRLLRYRF
jgi:O-methyltransferase involved in polyketide biosynthesis